MKESEQSLGGWWASRAGACHYEARKELDKDEQLPTNLKRNNQDKSARSSSASAFLILGIETE